MPRLGTGYPPKSWYGGERPTGPRCETSEHEIARYETASSQDGEAEVRDRVSIDVTVDGDLLAGLLDDAQFAGRAGKCAACR